MICPTCHRDVPSVLRGTQPYCSACGATLPFVATTASLNMAGRPAKVGGTVAHLGAAAALVVGGGIALVIGGLAQLLFHTGLLVASPIVALTLLIAVSLFVGGRKLHAAGEGQAQRARTKALTAYASASGGVVTARGVARALGLPEAAADELLTALAKDPEGHVSLEVDDGGQLTYLFRELVPRPRIAITEAGARVATPGAPRPDVVEAELVDDEELRESAPRARPRA